MTITINNLPEGKYRDRLNVGGKKIDFGWRSNVVVDQCRALIAAFIRGEATFGIQHIALGVGDVNWDDVAYESPLVSTFELVDSAPQTILIADAELQVEFIDLVGSVSLAPTNRLLVTATIEGSNLGLLPGETFPLREFALFGRLGVDNYMIDYVRHPVMNIGIDDVLTRQVRFIF